MSGTSSITNTGPNFIYVDSSYSNINGIYGYYQFSGYHYNLNNNAIRLYYYNGDGPWYWYFTDSTQPFNIIIQSNNGQFSNNALDAFTIDNCWDNHFGSINMKYIYAYTINLVGTFPNITYLVEITDTYYDLSGIRTLDLTSLNNTPIQGYTLDSIGDTAFVNVTITILNANNVSKIKTNAFLNCTIGTINIGKSNSSLTISTSAFALANITNININSSVIILQTDNWPNLFSFTFTNVALPYLTAIPDNLFKEAPFGKNQNLSFSENLITIGANAFQNATVKNDLFLANVNSIGVNAFDSMNMPNHNLSLPNLETISYNAFNNCNITFINLNNAKTINAEAFNNAKINHLTLGSNGMTLTIDTTAFQWATITNLTINSSILNQPGVSSINLFAGFTNTTFSCPNLTSIGAHVFQGVQFANVLGFNLTAVSSLGASAFQNCKSLMSITFANNTITEINRNTFQNCTSLTSVSLPDGLIYIKSGAFQGCTGLTSISIPTSVTTIEANAFQGCSGLTTITIHDGVTTIQTSAFQGCSGLTTITIPDGVTTIQTSAFQGCSGLNSITIPHGVTSIQASAFQDCTGLTSIIIPVSVATIGISAFQGCTSLTSINIPSSVTNINNTGFADCSVLNSIIFMGTKPAFGSDVFLNISPSATIYVNPFDTTWADYTYPSIQIDNSYIDISYNNIDYNSSQTVTISPTKFSGTNSIYILSNISAPSSIKEPSNNNEEITIFPHKLLGKTITYQNQYFPSISSDKVQCYILNSDSTIIEYQQIYFNMSQIEITINGTNLSNLSPIGTHIGTFKMTGINTLNGDGGFSYSLSGTDSDLFDICNTVLNPFLFNRAFFETSITDTYNITIKSFYNSQENLVDTQDFSINVINSINKYDIILTNQSILEDLSAGTLVGIFNTTDLSYNSNTNASLEQNFTYTLSGTDASSFEISGNQLLSKKIFDYLSKREYTIVVRSKSDITGDIILGQYVINIIQNGSNMVISLSNTDIYDNVPANSIVGSFFIYNPDNPLDIFTISLSPSSDFYIDTSNNLKTKHTFFLDESTSYPISVTVRDTEQNQKQYDVSINVIYQDVSSTGIELSDYYIEEDASSGHIVGTFSTYNPHTNQVFDYTLQSNPLNAFKIDGSNLIVTGDVSFNYFAQNVYPITVRSIARIYPLNFIDVSFLIVITQKNMLPTSIYLSNSDIFDNVPINTSIGYLKTNTKNLKADFSYSLVPNQNNAYFYIDNSTDTLHTKGLFDISATTSYLISILSTQIDNSSNMVTNEFSINVIYQDVSSTGIELSDYYIEEDASSGHIVGTFSTDNPHTNELFDYTLKSNPLNAFNIDGSNLIVTGDVSFNYFAQNVYPITVRSTATNYPLNFIDVSFLIVINSGNYLPTSINITNNDVLYTAQSNTYIGSLFTDTSNPLSNYTYQYSFDLSQNTTYNKFFDFSVSKSTTNLITSDVLFTRDMSYLQLYIKSTQTDNSLNTKTDIITINLLNDIKSTGIVLSNNTLNEDEPANTLIGTLATDNPYQGTEKFTYDLSGGDKAYFEISGNNMDMLYSNNLSFNYREKQLYTIYVTSTITVDLKTYQITVPFYIIITKGGELATSINLSNNDVLENSPIGTYIGTFTTNSPNPSAKFSYTLITSSIHNDFIIDGSSNLKTNSPLTVPTILSISVKSTNIENNVNNVTQDFSINVMSVEYNSTSIELSGQHNLNIDSPANTYIGTFTTDNPDLTEQFTYNLSGTDSEYFKIIKDSDGSSNLMSNDLSFNYLVKQIYSILVTSTSTTDNANIITRPFYIILTISNELITSINLSNNLVFENAPIGTYIGTFRLNSPDPSAYSISLDSNPNFIIDPETNNLKTKTRFEYDIKSTYSISVTATTATNAISQDFSINIVELDSITTAIRLSNNIINKNMSVGSIIGLLTTDNPDQSHAFTYDLSGPSVELFSIDGSNNLLVNSQTLLAYTSQSILSITVISTSTNSEPYEETFTIYQIIDNFNLSYQLVYTTLSAASINLFNTSNLTNYNNNIVYFILSLPVNGGTLFDITNGNYIYDVNTKPISSQIIYIPKLNFAGRDYFQIYTYPIRQIETIYIDFPDPNIILSVRNCCPAPVFYKAIQHLDIMGSAATRNMQFSKQLQLGRGKTQFISQNTNVVSKNPNPNNSSR